MFCHSWKCARGALVFRLLSALQGSRRYLQRLRVQALGVRASMWASSTSSFSLTCSLSRKRAIEPSLHFRSLRHHKTCRHVQYSRDGVISDRVHSVACHAAPSRWRNPLHLSRVGFRLCTSSPPTRVIFVARCSTPLFICTCTQARAHRRTLTNVMYFCIFPLAEPTAVFILLGRKWREPSQAHTLCARDLHTASVRACFFSSLFASPPPPFIRPAR